MITVLSEGTRKARKPHQCYHCYRTIPVGETYRFQTCKYDDVYTLCWHKDCAEAAEAYRRDQRLSVWDYDYGYPPLRDEWIDSGEFELMCNAYRGQFPHVVCRMELSEQKAALRHGEEVYG